VKKKQEKGEGDQGEDGQWRRECSACLQLRKSEADTNVTDLIAGYKEIDCMYQLTGNDDQGEMNKARGGPQRQREEATSGGRGEDREAGQRNPSIDVTVYRPPSSTPRTSSVVLKSARKGHKSVSSVS
jgi:hypothetical protein